MTSKLSIICSVLLVFLMNWHGAKAQSGCTSTIISLSPCLNYISGNSTNPSSSCCSRLSSVVQSQPQCLCSLLNGGSSNYGIAINQTQALALPGACRVQTPPVSQCDSGGAPATPSTPIVPASSPADSPDGGFSDDDPSNSGSDNPSGTGSKTGSDGAVGGSNINAKLSFFGVLLLIASSSTILASAF